MQKARKKTKNKNQHEHILAHTALLSTTTFEIRVYYITVLLFSPRENRNTKKIEKKRKKKNIPKVLLGTYCPSINNDIRK